MTVVANADTRNQTAADLALRTAEANSRSQADDTQQRFLTMLVTQLRNQDPLNPMDNAEVTSQLAQLSTVSGINQLNNTLLALSGQMDLSQSLQAASLIGRGVLIPGGAVKLGTAADGTGEREITPFGVDLMARAETVEVSILDAGGRVVRRIDLGAQDTGVLSVQWDGKDDAGNPVPDGKYSIEAAARDADGGRVSAETLTYGKVGSVAYTADGLRLDLGLAGQISLLDIRKVI